MRLLVSVVDEREAVEAVLGGADIVDVKNPSEGALGAHFPRVIRAVREIVPREIEVSAAVGDVPYLPGTVSLAALGAAVCGVDYVKIGMYGPRNFEEALVVSREACRAVKEYDEGVKVVLAGYADYARARCLNPLEIPELARRVGADVAMIDTKVKDGKKSLEFVSPVELAEFVEYAHDHGIAVALAGSLEAGDVRVAAELGVDIVGFRRAACGGDRVRGRVSRERVAALKRMLERASSTAPRS